MNPTKSPFALTRRATLAGLAALAMPAISGRAHAATTVSVALDWTPNTNHIGLFVAREKGFYKEAGLDVDILPYTDSSASTLVASGVANFGVFGTIDLFTQRAVGADLVATYAIVQTETGRVVFNGDRQDIHSPKDLDGKTYGGFGSDWESALLRSMIQHDGGKGEFETVTLGTSAYQALANGAVDFTVEVRTWEGVKAELDGAKQRTFRYGDYGVPDEYTTLIGSSSKFLAADPKAASAFLSATRRGYDFANSQPDAATDILIGANSDALTDRTFVRASMQALIDGHYLKGADGVIGSFDPAKMEAIGTYLFNVGILKDASGAALREKPDFAPYFTNDFLAAR
jgi:ABC-type nitrate/sulfonate/bicarbonate transport system substrate-binding protein